MSGVGHTYGVASLATHANDRLKALLGKDCGLNDDQVSRLPKIFEEARNATGDTRVRDTMARVAAVNVRALMDKDSFREQPYMTVFLLELVKALTHINDKVSERSSKQVANLKASLEDFKEKQHSAIENERSRLSAEFHNDKVKLQATLATEKSKLQPQLESERQKFTTKAEDTAMKHYQELQDQKTKFQTQLESERTRFRTETEDAAASHRSELQQEKARSNPAGLQGDVTRLRSEMEILRKKHNSEASNARKWYAELVDSRNEVASYENTVTMLADVDECRNHACYNDDFGCFVDTPNPEYSTYPFVLRCNACNCKHPG